MRVVVSVPTGRPVSRGDLLVLAVVAVRWGTCRCGRCTAPLTASMDPRFWLLVGASMGEA